MGQKKLLKMEEVNFVEEVPGWKSLSSKTIWS